jgi:hypothetical protein
MPREFATAVPFVAAGLIGPVGSTVYIHGITLRETGGTNAIAVTIRAGSVSGPIVAEFSLGSGAGLGNGILPRFKVPGQCYIQLTGAGTVSGVLYVS